MSVPLAAPNCALPVSVRSIGVVLSLVTKLLLASNPVTFNATPVPATSEYDAGVTWKLATGPGTVVTK